MFDLLEKLRVKWRRSDGGRVEEEVIPEEKKTFPLFHRKLTQRNKLNVIQAMLNMYLQYYCTTPDHSTEAQSNWRT